MLELGRENEKVRELLPFVADYRVNIIPVRAIEDPKKYKSCLQHIFYMLRFNEDKEKLYGYVNGHREEMDHMDGVEMAAAFAMLGERKRLKELVSRKKKEGKEIGMCKAIDDLILDGEKRGEERGREQGEKIGEKRGEKRGQERLARLIVVLAENHKDDLIIKAASDSAFRRKLFKEYNL